MGNARILRCLPNFSAAMAALGKWLSDIITKCPFPWAGLATLWDRSVPAHTVVDWRMTTWKQKMFSKSKSSLELQILRLWDGWSSEQNFMNWPNLEKCQRHQVQPNCHEQTAITWNTLNFWLQTKKLKGRNTIDSVPSLFYNYFFPT